MSADVLHEPVRLQLTVDNRTQSDAEMKSGTPLIWCLWPTFEDLDAITKWLPQRDPDNDGVAELGVGMSVRENGTRQLQATFAKVTIRGGNVYVGTVIGLNEGGHHALAALQLGESGVLQVDRALQRSADTVVRIMPPWNVAQPGGLVAGDVGCAPPGVADLFFHPR
jgi:hypothetical protein